MTVKHLDHLNLTVNNLAATADWYARVFGMQLVEENIDDQGTRWGILRGGEAMLCIYESPQLDRPAATTSEHRINHFGLRITDSRLTAPRE